MRKLGISNAIGLVETHSTEFASGVYFLRASFRMLGDQVPDLNILSLEEKTGKTGL